MLSYVASKTMLSKAFYEDVSSHISSFLEDPLARWQRGLMKGVFNELNDISCYLKDNELDFALGMTVDEDFIRMTHENAFKPVLKEIKMRVHIKCKSCHYRVARADSNGKICHNCIHDALFKKQYKLVKSKFDNFRSMANIGDALNLNIKSSIEYFLKLKLKNEVEQYIEYEYSELPDNVIRILRVR